ncbi:hypothetical protein QE363_003551 [Sphingomonas sp. SORGH_AS870]|uniref:DUF4253 domain-containing protein n=1 Tax=Sphingomonas sp. SORGH_AS_0870 TaxID=3041801 RepID=UPI00285AF126|nr:DUF4253 domain-containing protein [Sphingomonas sp. SORGH_AS_0870]MDR6147758.1 hypothetical protein [Sphingomonas sp. SORGH_AS_0870]
MGIFAGVAGIDCGRAHRHAKLHAMDPTRRWMIGGLAMGALLGATRPMGSGQVTDDLSHLTPEQRTRYQAMHQRMMAALTYERITVPGRNALAEWERLKGAGRGWPVVIGGDEDLERIAEQLSIDDPAMSGGPANRPAPRTPAQIVAAADALRFPADFHRWSKENGGEDLRAPVGEWPRDVGDGPEAPGLFVIEDGASGQVRDRVHIMMLPTSHAWEAPAYLRWGNWNACPPSEYHVAALRDWNRRYGAELVGINGDTMNIRVRTRPKDRAEALGLAREMYEYCPDIIEQGAGTLSNLAAGLMTSNWWFFWWD